MTRLDRTVEAWRRWSQQLAPLGRWTPAITRSALALKTLITEASGAVAAAVTTSLPERIGGDKNWDYRYAWVRDSSFTIDALISLGLHEEAHGAVSWILDAVRRNGPDLRVFYTLAGSPRTEAHLAAPGYRHSAPVRAGNAAATQIQLGTYGDLFDTIFRYTEEGHILDPGTGRMLADLADRCCDDWRSPDSGIWELDDLEHYTISKIGCWVALDRAVRPGRAPDRSPPSARRVGRQKPGTSGHGSIGGAGRSRKKPMSSTRAPTPGCLGAPVRSAPGLTGVPAWPRPSTATRDRTRTRPVVRAIFRAKGTRVHLWRARSGWFRPWPDRSKGTCLPPDGRSGRPHNDLGLLSEQIDRRSGEFLGNVPQALSHLALINAATELHRTTEP